MNRKRLEEDEMWVKAFEIIAKKQEEINALYEERKELQELLVEQERHIYNLKKGIEELARATKCKSTEKEWWEKGV